MPEYAAVSPELALVDPLLAAEERARLPERPPSPLVPTEVEALPGDRRGLQTLALAALAAHELDAVASKPIRHTWPRLAALTVVTVMALLLLDVRVDVGRTPAVAESSFIVPPAADPSPGQATKNSQNPPGTKPSPGAPPVAAKRQDPIEQTKKPVSRRFAWAPVARADSYRVELFRGDARVFVATSNSAQLTVPARWRLDGRRRTLTPGVYRWYVWPITSGRRAPNAVVQATLNVR
jgi:hypothetical protein